MFINVNAPILLSLTWSSSSGSYAFNDVLLYRWHTATASSWIYCYSIAVYLSQVCRRTCFRYDVEGRRGLLLRLVCSWVGSELSRLRSAVNRRADEFKTRNIDCIDRLPNARQTVDFVFPQCMVLLILGWMNDADAGRNTCQQYMCHARAAETVCDSAKPTGEQCRSISESNNADHCYTTDCSQDHLYAFVQLILEFANGCLISGITHVLYPRLLQSQI